jgi:hypothetical protein
VCAASLHPCTCLCRASGARGCTTALRVLQRTPSPMCAARPGAQVYVDTVGDAVQYHERLSLRYPGIRRVRRPVRLPILQLCMHMRVLVAA